MQHINKSKKKSIIVSSWILVFLWMGFIFYMSAQDSTESSSFSRPIAESVVEFQTKYHLTPDYGYSSVEYIDRIEAIIRMIAHSTVFFILSVLVSLSLLLSNIKRRRVLFISIALSLLYAFVDEFHQFFVPGRASEMADIYHDMFGIILGTMLTVIAATLYIRLHKKRKPLPDKSEKLPDKPLDEKILAFKPKEQPKPFSAPVKEKASSMSSALAKNINLQKLKESEIIIPIWIKLGFIVSFSVLCALISSSVKYMPFVAILAFLVMLAVVFKTKFLDNNIKKLKPSRILISTVLAIFTIIRVYASFRLVANSYIAEQGTVIEDFYYNFIRSSLSAFAVPAIITLWYILLEKAQKLIKQIKFTKFEVVYMSVLTGLSFFVLLYIYYRTHLFFSPPEHNNVIFSLDSFTVINEFSYTNFTSGINTIFQPVFTLGAMPFGVISRIFSYPLTLLPRYSMVNAEALSLSSVNATLLGVSIVLFSRVFNVKNKALFIIFMTITFPSLFSLLMVSGNIVTTFYMAVFLFVLTKTNFDYAPLLTVLSAGFLPFAAIPLAVNKRKKKLQNTVKAYIYLAACIFLCSNILGYGNILGTVKHIPRLNEIIPSVLNLSFMSIFVPKGIVTSTPYYAYEYTPSTLSYIGGMVIAVAAFAGFLLNRKNQASKIGFFAIVVGALFSLYFVATLVPSGIMLYLICFSWAFISLIYILAEKLFKPDSKLLKIVMVLVIMILAIYNFNAIRDIIVFSFNYYTV